MIANRNIYHIFGFANLVFSIVGYFAKFFIHHAFLPFYIGSYNEMELINYNDALKLMTEQCRRTMTQECDNAAYLVPGLTGEWGEFCEKLAKQVRHKTMVMTPSGHYFPVGLDKIEKTAKTHELAMEWFDCMWFLLNIAHEFSFDPDEAFAIGLAKLARRKADNTIDGNGDNERTKL